MAYLDTVEEDADAPVADPETQLLRLKQLAKIPNLALESAIFGEGDGDSELNKIGMLVCRETEIDLQSRQEWEKRTQAGMDLALQKGKPKTFPWPGAANVRFPLMTSASIQFAARAYPAIVSGTQVVRTQIVGEDPDGTKKDRGDRIAAHMSWQLLNEMKEWEADVDRMLHGLSIIGCAFKKTYFDPDLDRPRSDYITAFDLIVNNGARSLSSAPRVTHRFKLYPHEIKERILSGVFKSFEYGVTSEGETEDEDAPHTFYEQHRRWDLDKDGYPEPYIMTVHKETQKVCRVRANWDEKSIRRPTMRNKETGMDDPVPGRGLIGIDPIEYFTKIPFIPNPEGGFYEIGFGWLLSPLNEAINTVINQILDAGTLANTGGGFIGSGLRLKGGTMRFLPGEYKEVDVSGTTARENVVPLTFPGPSPTLFQMLGHLIDAGREVASVKDVLTGEISAQTMQPGTAMALIEQGLKVFTSIYKRIHRALKEEFKKIYEINREFFDEAEYARITDAPEVSMEDYKADPTDIVPVSDPSMVADLQRISRAEFLERYKQEPWIDPMAITRRQWEAAGIENVSELFAKREGPSPQEIMAKRREEAELQDLKSKIDLNVARTLESIARAEGEEAGVQLEKYKAIMDSVIAMREAETKIAEAQKPPSGNGAGP